MENEMKAAIAIAVVISILGCTQQKQEQKQKVDPTIAALEQKQEQKQKVDPTMAALEMCQALIKRSAKDPEKANVPAVADKGEGTDFYDFVWSGETKLARMRNGLGLEVGVSAECELRRSDLTDIKTLIVGDVVVTSY